MSKLSGVEWGELLEYAESLSECGVVCSVNFSMRGGVIECSSLSAHDGSLDSNNSLSNYETKHYWEMEDCHSLKDYTDELYKLYKIVVDKEVLIP